MSETPHVAWIPQIERWKVPKAVRSGGRPHRVYEYTRLRGGVADHGRRLSVHAGAQGVYRWRVRICCRHERNVCSIIIGSRVVC